MSVADDYGRFHGSSATVRGACWPTCPDKFSDANVSGWLDECCASDYPLIIRYESGGAKYLQIDNFGQQTRAKSKYPEMTETNRLANAQPSRISESYFDSRISESRVGSAPTANQIAKEAEETRKAAIVETLIRGLAAGQPDPQDFELGISAAVREFLSSANPDITLAVMQEHLPLWWAAMKDGRARVKPMRFLIVDRDYLRKPNASPRAGKSQESRSDEQIRVMKERAAKHFEKKEIA